MLVLSRKKTESIVINSDIRVTVVEIRGNKVKIGIDAPGEVPVHRQELFDAVAADRDGKTKAMSDQSLLVVSNDHRTRSSVARMLADEGGDVDTANSLNRALEYVDEKEYDIAIIDECLERASGQELFEQIRRCQTDVKGILCSHRPTVDTVETAIESGMDHVVQTPIDHSELLSLVMN